jgi:hypothetical protein
MPRGRRTDVAWRHTLDIDPRLAELRMPSGAPAPAHLVLADAATC